MQPKFSFARFYNSSFHVDMKSCIGYKTLNHSYFFLRGESDLQRNEFGSCYHGSNTHATGVFWSQDRMSAQTDYRCSLRWALKLRGSSTKLFLSVMHIAIK